MFQGKLHKNITFNKYKWQLKLNDIILLIYMCVQEIIKKSRRMHFKISGYLHSEEREVNRIKIKAH